MLRPVRTWSEFDPHRSHTSIRFVQNWINPLRLCQHYDLNSWKFIHKAQLWLRDCLLATRWCIVLFLDIPSSWLWTLSAPHTTSNNAFVSSTLQGLLDIYKYVLQLITSAIATWLLHFWWWSTSYPDPICLPEVDRLDRDLIHINSPMQKAPKCGQDWNRSDRDSIAIEALVWTGLKSGCVCMLCCLLVEDKFSQVTKSQTQYTCKHLA